MSETMTQKKFITIYETLRKDIIESRISYGAQLPSEHELVESYQASRETVRKALNLLVREGMIQKDSRERFYCYLSRCNRISFC